MKKLLCKPLFNAVCTALFSGFYFVVFALIAYRDALALELTYAGGSRLWSAWGRLLAADGHIYIGCALLAITLLTVLLLVRRGRDFDEYHLSILLNCLVAAVVLTLLAVAVFYVTVLLDPTGLMEKFTLFVLVQWAVVVVSDLIYVLICRQQ